LFNVANSITLLRFALVPALALQLCCAYGARCSAYGGNNSMVTHAAWTSYFAGNGNRSIISERDRVAARVRHWRSSRTTPAFASASVGHCTRVLWSYSHAASVLIVVAGCRWDKGDVGKWPAQFQELL